MRQYPRWQVALTDTLFTRAVRRGMDLERSRRTQWRVARALGQPLSPRAWSTMTFNDKVLYRKLREHASWFRTASDKLAMREFVAGVLGESVLPRLLTVAHAATDLADVRGPFALKASHGSGLVLLVPDARPLTAAETTTVDEWLGEDFGYWSREWAYEALPRALMIEELLASPPPPDYKFFVFNGVPRAVQVDERRFAGHERSIMSMQWERWGGCRYPQPATAPARPDNFDTMAEFAAALGADRDFVRVDLYDLGDRVVVGELTVYPEAGRGAFSPPGLDRRLGAFWTTPPAQSGVT